MRSSAQRIAEHRIDRDDVLDARTSTSARRRHYEARQAESGTVLNSYDVLRILEPSIADLDRLLAVPASFAVPRIAGVEHFEHPMLRGDLDAPLAAGEEVHVFDALTGENLGAAMVEHRSWTFEDTRAMSHGQTVVYITRVIDVEGGVGELSNACEFIFGRPAAGVRRPSAGSSAGIVASEMSESSVTSIVALITEVTSQCRKKVVAHSRRRSGDTKASKKACRRVITGTLSETLRVGEAVHVFDGSIDLGRASVRGKTWTLCDARILRIGSALSYTAHVADRAGNLGPASSIYMMTVGETTD